MSTASASVEPGTATTREQIVGAALGFIQTRSYLGFSFQDVANKIGIRKASLYHHFPTKEALGVEVLRQSIQGFKDWAARSRKPEESLDAYFRMYRNGLHAGEGVCPAGALAPGWDCINDELKQAVRELRGTQILWLTGVLGALAPAGGHAVPAGTRAAYVFTVCQGALMTARMTGRVDDFDETIQLLKQSIAH
jgi:TetR/AcrR family transcriptional repressor of nem operon